MEKKHLLGDVDGRRPGDVTIPVWRANKGLAIDVAVTSPLASSNLHHKEPCEVYATHHKHAYYDADFKGTAFEFAAVVFETTGGVNNEGLKCFVSCFVSQQSTKVFSSVCTADVPGLACLATFRILYLNVF